MKCKGNGFWELGISAISNETQFKKDTNQQIRSLHVYKFKSLVFEIKNSLSYYQHPTPNTQHPTPNTQHPTPKFP